MPVCASGASITMQLPNVANLSGRTVHADDPPRLLQFEDLAQRRSLLGIAGGVEAPTYADLYSGAWTHPTSSGCLR